MSETTAVLNIGLLAAQDEVLAALRAVVDSESLQQYELTAPEKMTEQDWDDCLKLVLSATRVITV